MTVAIHHLMAADLSYGYLDLDLDSLSTPQVDRTAVLDGTPNHNGHCLDTGEQGAIGLMREVEVV